VAAARLEGGALVSRANERPLSLGVLVPCRDEVRVIGGKLADLLAADWPAGGRHRLVVVDDGSTDGTADAARRALPGSHGPLGPIEAGKGAARVEARVVPNALAPGKGSAVRAGLAALEGVDVVVLTDADVRIGRGALLAIERAFGNEPELLLASGAQEVVHELDGRGPLRSAADLYDRASELVRALESRSGRLFSVHGQLLAWRAGRGLAPAPRLAADDLDLVFQARARGGRVRRLADARFQEARTPPGPIADAQALRRARAYFQALDGRPAAALGPAALDRLQWAFYRRVPGRAPELAALGAGLGLGLAYAAGGPLAALGLAGAGLAALASRRGRGVLRTLRVIARARPAASWRGSSDRWEMPREIRRA